MMNSMAMAGMNPAQGGPVGGSVGGGMMMMNNGAPATPSNGNTQENMKTQLNTYIYDYFLNFGFHDHARTLARDDKFEIMTMPPIKSSPGRRKDGEVNGIDENAMDTDTKDDLIIPGDLPRPQVPSACPGSAFLFDWFCLFHDIFNAQRGRKSGQRDLTSAQQYLEQTQSLQRMRENQQNAQLMRGSQMMGGPNQFPGMRGVRNGMMANDMRAAAMQKNGMTPQQLQQMQQIQQQKMMHQQHHQMQREHSDMDMNGHRPGSPADPENAGSPSKRPRLGEQQFNGGQMGPNGRGQGVPGVGPQGGGMLMQTGLNPKAMAQGQFQGFAGPNQAVNQAVQQKLMQGAMPNGMMNPAVMGNQGSPMLQPMGDGQFMGGMPIGDLYSAQMRANGAMQGPGATGGNHALQDYQMQLMLLEQQNKKRLMMARQEQDNISRDGGPIPAQSGMQPPGMSPSGSRTGTSPNPNEQMKRGTPQMAGLPGSPAPGDMQQGRASPAAMGFMGNMPPDFSNPMMMKNGTEGMIGPGGPGMRPNPAMNPNLNMEAIARSQQGRLPAGNWQPGPQPQPMMPQPSQGQPQPMGTPTQRSDMPPPQAPATGSANANRTQPSSPQTGQAPPTPSQSNKPNPKKKDKTETRKRPNKKNSTANAPASSESERPATPTPSTPITPVHPNSFASGAGKGPHANAASAGAAPANAAPTSNPSAPSQQSIPPPDLQGPGAFGDPGFPDPTFNMDFGNLEGSDVLDSFDFDSFLNQDDNSGGFFDPSLNADVTFSMETAGVE